MIQDKKWFSFAFYCTSSEFMRLFFYFSISLQVSVNHELSGKLKNCIRSQFLNWYFKLTSWEIVGKWPKAFGNSWLNYLMKDTVLLTELDQIYIHDKTNCIRDVFDLYQIILTFLCVWKKLILVFSSTCIIPSLTIELTVDAKGEKF
jgi:hypothetical protein